MTRKVREAVGCPDNGFFIKKCIIYAILLALMLFAAPYVFAKTMPPMAAQGMQAAWFGVFVPLAVAMMAYSLFRSWRRRWPLAYMVRYAAQAKREDYETCPRCGEPLVLKRRSRNHREKVGELITTTTYGDGSKTVDRKDVYGTVNRTHYYHECTNRLCRLEAEQSISDSHLPWKMREIRCLVLNDSSLLSRKRTCARDILLSRLMAPILAMVLVLASAVTIYQYADMQDGEWTTATADQEPVRSAEDFRSYLLGLDNAYPNWHMTYENAPSDMMSYLGDVVLHRNKATGYTLECYTVDGNPVMCYRFEGNDAGTGIPDGAYMLAKVDGAHVLLDEDKEIIYKQGTEFYDTYAPKLQALSHDNELTAAMERVDGGEHAIHDSALPLEFIRKDNAMLYAYMLEDDVSKIYGNEYGGEFRAVSLHPEELTTERWSFSYSSEEYNPVDMEDYVYSDEAPAN